MNTKIYTSDAVKKVRLLHREVINQMTSNTTVKSQLKLISENLLTEHERANSATQIEISNWHPDFVGKDTETIMNSVFGIADAKLTIAKGYGFKDWEDVLGRGEIKFNMKFEHAIDTMLNGNINSLRKQVKRNKDILSERSRYGHRATLLHYVSSNGVEIRRQKVPLNLAEITKFLIESGADKNTKAHFYGGEFTALELAKTSAHPKDAGIMESLINVLQYSG